MSNTAIDFKPYEYQKRAIKFVEDNPFCALFLDMGLGKTVSTLTAIKNLIAWGEVEKALVIAPKTVAEGTWSAEVDKWKHLKGLRVSLIAGNETKRKRALMAEAEIYVISRDNFVWLTCLCGGHLRMFDMVVIDELTSFKTQKSKRFKAFRLARPFMQRVVGLTGTPASNGYKDLWAQMYCIDQGERLGKSSTMFLGLYFDTYRRGQMLLKCDLLKGADEAIRGKIRDITLTMTTEDYITLPDFVEIDIPVKLSDSHAKAYTTFERDMVLSLPSSEDSSIIANGAAALMTKLSQYANGAIYNDDGDVKHLHDEKLEALSELIEQANSPVLVFYQFRHDCERIMGKLKHLKVRKYEGVQDLEAWNAGKIDVLLSHPASTAYGLNMQQGGHIIVWYGTGWNCELYLQSCKRLHRQGQKHPVRCYRLFVVGTVDETQMLAISRKKATQAALLEALKERIKKYKG